MISIGHSANIPAKSALNPIEIIMDAATSRPAASQTGFFEEVVQLFGSPLKLHAGANRPLSAILVYAEHLPLLLSESVTVGFRLSPALDPYYFIFDSRYSIPENISRLEQYVASRPEPLKKQRRKS